MRQEITKVYQQKDKNKSELFKIKNKCFAKIYGMVLDGKSIRDIHKELLRYTINHKKLFAFMSKVTSKAVKTVDKRKNKTENAVLLLWLFNRERYNSKSKKLINHEIMEKAEFDKDKVIKNYIEKSEAAGRWIYLASSHNDCAVDHLPYQGRLYYDNKAPDDIKKYCESKGMPTIQWVMNAPAWFITRPNCRHFFKSLPIDVVKKYSVKELKRRYKTHRMDGDKSLATPRKIAVEEYEDRLKMLQAMYNEYPTEHLRREIQKIKLLIKKWKNTL